MPGPKKRERGKEGVATPRPCKEVSCGHQTTTDKYIKSHTGTTRVSRSNTTADARKIRKTTVISNPSVGSETPTSRAEHNRFAYERRRQTRLRRHASAGGVNGNIRAESGRDESSAREHLGEDVGASDKRQQTVPVEPVGPIPTIATIRTARPVDSGLCGSVTSPHTGKACLHQTAGSHDGAPMYSSADRKTYEARVGKHGSADSGRDSGSGYQRTSEIANGKSAGTMVCDMADVEDGVKMGRSSRHYDGIILDGESAGDNTTIWQNQRQSAANHESVINYPHFGSGANGKAGSFPTLHEAWGAANESITRTTSCRNPASYTTINCPLVQKRCDGYSDTGSGERRFGTAPCPIGVETCGQEVRLPVPDNGICERTREICQDIRNWKSHFPALKQATITVAKKSSKVATKEEEKTIPVHFPQVTTADIAKLRERMNERTKARFDKIWRHTTNFKPSQFVVNHPMKCCSTDAKQAVANDIAVRLPAGTPVTCHAFSVKEVKKKGWRRRALHWAKPFNDHTKDVYKADVNLRHPSEYFDRVNAETGATFDLKAGFFQVGLPKYNLFTFMDDEGNIYGLKRLPMGICTSPEIMQIITSVLAGDPTMVVPKYAVNVTTDVWIDNILYSGSKERVNKAVAKFKRAALECGVTINWDESTENQEELDFIGMTLNFQKHTIDLARKNRDKIRDICFTDHMHVCELETAAARLMYASSILRVPLSKYYFAIKFLRRKLSEINRETLKRSEIINVPASALKNYKAWQADLNSAKARSLPQEEGRKAYTLWTDSSLVGWGAVLIEDATQRIRIVAGKWTPAEQMAHINILEINAVALGLERFLCLDGAVVQPRIDNTSALGAIKKGYSHSYDLNEGARTIQEITKRRNILLKKPQFVRSADNIADHWSRVFDSRGG